MNKSQGQTKESVQVAIVASIKILIEDIFGLALNIKVHIS